MQSYIPNFEHLRQVVLKKKTFLFFFLCISMIGPHGAGPSWTLGPSFEQTWQRTTRQS